LRERRRASDESGGKTRAAKRALEQTITERPEVRDATPAIADLDGDGKA
jgi:hypothetical protein